MNNDIAPEALAKLQTSFAGHIRNPESVPALDGIEDRRMAIYRELFFNNIVTFLSSNFPVLKTLFSKQDWGNLCRDFYTDYRCHTPLFPEIPREFLRYLQNHRRDHEGDPPFMLELAHYEWVELALELDEAEVDAIEVNPKGDLLNGIPVLSPLAWPLSYQYPVHEIRVDFQPDTVPDKPTHLLVWRQQNFSIKFMQLNEISLLLLQKLKEDPACSGLELLTEIAGIIDHPKPEVVIEGGKALLNELLEKQVILGTRP
ncbi:MAG: DUF2063 domain-containing protein [Xanthomonadales bacterium]|nr:DUF2063 domain-containing protein [Xanthomonadales bacterium]